MSAAAVAESAPGSQANSLVAKIAEMVASDLPGAELAVNSLGSCLAVIAYDPVVKIGGILCFMLPDSSINPARAEKSPFMFADTGVPRLLDAVYKLGAEKNRLVVKVAGGSRFLDDTRSLNVGQRNVETLMQVLEANGLSPESTDVGGRVSRNVKLSLTTGEVTVATPGNEPYVL